MYRALGRADRSGSLARQLYVLLANLRQCDGMVDLPVAFHDRNASQIATVLVMDSCASKIQATHAVNWVLH